MQMGVALFYCCFLPVLSENPCHKLSCEYLLTDDASREMVPSGTRYLIDPQWTGVLAATPGEGGTGCPLRTENIPVLR